MSNLFEVGHDLYALESAVERVIRHMREGQDVVPEISAAADRLAQALEERGDMTRRQQGLARGLVERKSA